MKGDIVYHILGIHEGRTDDTNFGTFQTHHEAESEISKLRKLHGPIWEERYHNRGFVIRKSIVDTDFQIPELPKPRDKYFAKGAPKANRPGTWDSTIVQVHRRGVDASETKLICEYERNYGLLQTFEPFRKDGRDYALISRDYTKAAVLDLSTGLVIAEESEDSPGAGFCPVGFYVPDWWDIHRDSVIPGSPYWDDDLEWPTGMFGFVWGCYWGDDSSWKVQYLDLKEIENGVISRDERFGYVELATSGYSSPSLDPSASVDNHGSKPPPFISMTRTKGHCTVRFSVEMGFNLADGNCQAWRRTGDPYE